MEVKNILVPVDFSKCSKNALKVAIKLARKSNAKIHMVNAVHVHTPHPDLAGGSLIDAIISDYESQVKESFEELEKDLIELGDVPHESDRFISYLSDAIRAETEQKDIDLIVMGTRSDHEGIERIVGTNASDIVQNSDVPVLVLPENVDHFEPKKIGFASDFKKVADHGSYEILRWLAGLYNAEIMVFHIDDEIVNVTLEEEKEIKEIQQRLEGIESSVRTVAAESIEEGVIDFVDGHSLDALALMPRKHNILHKLFKKSYTKSLVIDPVVPMLTFKDI
jgi:nucleotide-binding universal stress UspA family protein